MCGEPPEAGGAALSATELEQLSAELRSEDEAGRLHAGYALGMAAPATPAAVPALAAALREQVQAMEAGIVWDQVDFIEAARPPANLHGTNPTALSAAQGLCAAGGAATPALVELLADEAAPWLLHVYVLDALGLQGAPALGATASP